MNQQNPHYTSLRARANSAGDKMAKCFEQSREAYSRRDGALAKQLSEEGKKHKAEMERLNKEASGWIFAGEYDVSQGFTYLLAEQPFYTICDFIENNKVCFILWCLNAIKLNYINIAYNFRIMNPEKSIFMVYT